MPPTCFSNSPLLINMSFLVTSKDIQVKKGFATERAHQPHSQVYLPDVGTDEVDGPSLQSSIRHLYTLLMPLAWILRGCMWARIAEEVGPVAWPAGSETLGPVDSWGGGWEMVMLGANGGFFTGGWDGTEWGYDVTPLKSP